ncbi:MAG TPA: biotin/lipoyl-containing protein, partial [Solirubrobacterales bacterium]
MPETATVQITMPEMGESVTEGIVLEWHVAEGDTVSEGDTIVEVSTDKVDAEVPAPADGVVTKLLVSVDDEVKVGQPLAEMEAGSGEEQSAAPTGGAEAADSQSSNGGGKELVVSMPEMGESVSSGVILEWHVAEGDSVSEGDTVVEISTDKVDAEVPAPADGVITKLLAQVDDEVKVGQPLAEMSASAGGAAPAGDAVGGTAPEEASAPAGGGGSPTAAGPAGNGSSSADVRATPVAR